MQRAYSSRSRFSSKRRDCFRLNSNDTGVLRLGMGMAVCALTRWARPFGDPFHRAAAENGDCCAAAGRGGDARGVARTGDVGDLE
jgi:hypothetical protein